MPRKKKPDPATMPEELDHQLLPMPVPAGTGRPHEHRVDPYRTLPGAVPAPEEPPKKRGKRPTKDELAEQQREHGRMRLARYDRFLDALAVNGGDEIDALAKVYGVTPQEADARRDELIADVQAGVPTSSIGEDMRRRHLSDAAIARVLAKWVYSDNPAASLNAIKQVREVAEAAPNTGSFEQYARIATSRE